MISKKRGELSSKNWHDKEIKQAEKILERTEKHDVFFSKIIFWSALIVIIFANLIVSLVLIPFLIVLNQWVLYFTVVILAGTIGFLYTFLITDIGHLEKKHHILAGIIVPVLALANMTIMVIVSNRFIADLKINNPAHNPWLIAIVFVVAFILPYFIGLFRGQHRFKND